MNREIKFRVWDTFDKCFRDNVFIVANKPTTGKERMSFMFFTGLKDKNGKDIYEGDILRSPDPEIKYCLVEWSKKHACFQINGYGNQMWHNENSGEEYDSKISMVEENCLVFSSTDELEVIGNIYQNSELLK